MKKIWMCTVVFFNIFMLVSNVSFSSNKTKTAIFAGGCFWSMQHDFEKLNGIISTTVGYTGGTVANPTYAQVSSGKTGHYEAIKIVYNPKEISYEKILDFYWHDTDPTNGSGQFCDSGSEYRPVIFYLSAFQEKIATHSKNMIENSHQLGYIATKIMPAKLFYPAEEYHQHYSDKNPLAYDAYRIGCGRDRTLQRIWNKK